MVKKILLIPLLGISMVFLTKCTDDPVYLSSDDQTSEATPGTGKKGGGGHTEAAVNNLSFPVFALNNFQITPIPSSVWTTPYSGPYTGLTAEELEIVSTGDWYAQKIAGNTWQAEIRRSSEPLSVAFIDWGDVIESVNPKINRPFRLEVTLYVDVSGGQMSGYRMAMLAFPSSPQEVQGTNEGQYYEDGNWATIASSSPALRIQQLKYKPESVSDITWDPDEKIWEGAAVGNETIISFAPELNVGGKYIYGASQGGWTPTVSGLYRITFYMKDNPESAIDLSVAAIRNYIGNDDPPGTGETNASTPVVDAVNNITYVDVNVVAGGGGGRGRQ